MNGERVSELLYFSVNFSVLKRPNPLGFFEFYWVLGFIGFSDFFI